MKLLIRIFLILVTLPIFLVMAPVGLLAALVVAGFRLGYYAFPLMWDKS